MMGVNIDEPRMSALRRKFKRRGLEPDDGRMAEWTNALANIVMMVRQ